MDISKMKEELNTYLDGAIMAYKTIGCDDLPYLLQEVHFAKKRIRTKKA